MINAPANNRRYMQQLEWPEPWRSKTSGGDLGRLYSNFGEYALESSKSLSSLPVPIVKSVGQRSALSIPIITIIGVQKGGTTNLRENLLKHPMVCGKRHEVHFFDQDPSVYPSVGDWERDGLDNSLGYLDAGLILANYAEMCASKKCSFFDRTSRTFRTDRVIVDSAPRYIYSPVAPYRIKMARPGGKFVVVLRDPTDRYFSHMRMDMCRQNFDVGFATRDEKISTIYHLPGEAKDYLARADQTHQPYSAVCRGENASASDLWACYEAMHNYNPLYRGLYADQFERWFRVFDRSQMMIIDGSDMLKDLTAVVAAVTEFAGMPEHNYTYDSSHEHKTGCGRLKTGRYKKMFEEVELFRDWYRPHNERLYKLLGRDFMWQ
eukprot:jgi/Undpi1/12432/HiC_scaffold_5.g02103.m1